MKLYNLYKEIILEESISSETDLTIGKTTSQISRLIDIAIEGGNTKKDGRPYTNWVNIWYKKNENSPPRKMFVYILGRGKLKGGSNEDAIRVWDPGYGGTKRPQRHKTLLVRKITMIKVLNNPRQYDNSEFQSYVKNKINPPNDKLFQGGRYQDGKSVKI